MGKMVAAFSDSEEYIMGKNSGEKSQDAGGHIQFAPQRGDIRFGELGKYPGTGVREGYRPVFSVSNDTANGIPGH